MVLTGGGGKAAIVTVRYRAFVEGIAGGRVGEGGIGEVGGQLGGSTLKMMGS